ncbi:MAG TPA: class I adenylate-forming enzyme family protein [Aestuariivirga sp.]
MSTPGSSQNALFEETFKRYGSSLAMVTPDGQNLSFDKLHSTVKHFAAKLRQLGVRPGQVVAPFSENPAIFYTLILALLRIGATAACLPSVDRAAKDGLIVDYAISLADRPSITARNLIFDQSWFDAEGNDAIGPDGGFVFSSSGTTGSPKYYYVRETLLKAWSEFSIAGIGDERMDTLVTLPVFSPYGLKCVSHCHFLGGAVFFPRSTAAATLEALRPVHPLDAMTTPAVFADLLGAIKSGSPAPKFQRIVLGGSPVAIELARQGEDMLGCKVYNAYGSTEACVNAVVHVASSPFPKGHAGRPFRGVQFFIEDDEGKPLPPNQEGHVKILVPPDCRMDKPLIGASPYDEHGRFLSGDIGYLAAEGDLIITGRSGDRINSSGSKVAPERYEALALQHVKATQIAAFGIPNALGSDDVGIALVSDETVDLTALKAQMEQVIGTHLKVFVFKVKALPVNATGKIDRQALRMSLAPEGSPVHSS